MAVGWWAEAIPWSRTVFGKLATHAEGEQIPPDHDGAVATVLKKLVTALSGDQSQSGTSVSSMKKMVTAASGTMTPAAVAHDATGPGNNTFSTSMNWTHTNVSNDVLVMVDLICSQADGATVTCGGVSMTPDESENIGGTAWAFRFFLSGVSSGAKTIVVTPDANTEMVGRSVSYAHAVSRDTTTVASGTGTSPSQGGTADTSEMIVHGFFVYNASATGVTLSSPTGGTSRYNHSGSGRTAIQLSDSPSSATFGVTINASRPWVGFTTVLNPV